MRLYVYCLNILRGCNLLIIQRLSSIINVKNRLGHLVIPAWVVGTCCLYTIPANFSAAQQSGEFRGQGEFVPCKAWLGLPWGGCEFGESHVKAVPWPFLPGPFLPPSARGVTELEMCRREVRKV